jgi:hypothetical protein
LEFTWAWAGIAIHASIVAATMNVLNAILAVSLP